MCSFVDFEILGSRKHFAACWKWTGKWFLPRMHPDVINQLVLGLERATIPWTPVPEARVRRTLRAAYVLHR